MTKKQDAIREMDRVFVKANAEGLMDEVFLFRATRAEGWDKALHLVYMCELMMEDLLVLQLKEMKQQQCVAMLRALCGDQDGSFQCSSEEGEE